MKKLTSTLFAVAALALISVCTGCSNAFESISETSSIKINTRELLAGISANRSVYARQAGEEIIAELSITVSGSGIKTQTKNIGFTGRTIEEYLCGDKSIVFTGIPEGKEITISGKFKYLPQTYTTKDGVQTEETKPERWTGTVKYITGSKDPAPLALTPDIPETEKVYHAVNEMNAGSDTFTLDYILQAENLGFENGDAIKIIFDDNIALNAPVNVKSTGVYYHINLNGHSLILNYDGEAFEDSDAGITLNSTAVISNGDASNLYFYNGTITTQDTSSTGWFKNFYLNGLDKGGILFFKNCRFEGLKNQIIYCYGQGKIYLNNCSFNNCIIDSGVEQSVPVIQTSPYTDDSAATLHLGEVSFRGCKTYEAREDGNKIIKPLIEFKGTAEIFNSFFETDYSDYSDAQCDAAVIKVLDASDLYLEGTSIKSKGEFWAISAESDSNIILDGTEDKTIVYKPSSIESNNAVNLTCTYKKPSKLVMHKKSRISGIVNLDWYLTEDNDSIDGFSLIGTRNLVSSSKINLTVNDTEEYELNNSTVLMSAWYKRTPNEGEIAEPEELDDISKTLKHLDTSLIAEEWAIDDDGCLEDIRQ